jgi:hypothetical protein
VLNEHAHNPREALPDEIEVIFKFPCPSYHIDLKPSRIASLTALDKIA